ncbi:unnamed protein product [Coregonus sp. 'balchen']|nr:unnamed protein product [Coregonus sp. 'balchen']
MGCGKVLWAVVGAAVVITLITVPMAIYLNREDGGPKRPFTLADYFNDTIRYKIYNLRWISDNEYVHKTRQGNIMLHNAETGDFFEYISNKTFEQVDATDYIISADRKYICFESNYSKAYVWNYNVYLKPNATAEAIQVTHNGKENQILNGAPDWVYEEEVFSSNEAIWWSPTGKYLAYAEFNDTEVHTIEYSLYGYGQYPRTVVVPYPKAGSTNPKAKLFVVDTTNPSRRSQVVVPDSIGAGDHYLSSVTWVMDERIAVQWTKRKQNHVLLQMYDFDGNNWNENQKYEQISKTGWVGQYAPLQPMFALDHISFYKVMSDTYDTMVTIGSSHSAPQCLTCGLYKDRCQYNSAYFSYDASFYRMDCYGPGTPLFTLRDNRGSGEELLVLRDNKDLEDMLKEFQMPTMQRGTLRVAGFDYRYRLNWGSYLSSTEGIIVASFDGRGSGYQGDKIMHSIYQRLGTFEVEDQITAVRKFIDMGFIDKERIAIWGWSYGGYVTSMALGAGSGVFKCGIAVAPVAKWEYYVTSRAKNFKSVDYLLIHGTADDNVHFQQSAQISKALVDQQVDFEAMWYTDRDHGLGGSAYHHLYTHMSQFLQKCLVKPKLI